MGIVVGAIRATVNRSTDFTSNRMMLDAIGFDVGEEAKSGGTFRANFKDCWVKAHRKAKEILEGL